MSRHDVYEVVGSLSLDEAHEVVEVVLGVTLEPRNSYFLGGDYSGTPVQEHAEKIRLIPNYSDEEGYLHEDRIAEGGMLLYLERSQRWDAIDSALSADQRFVHRRTSLSTKKGAVERSTRPAPRLIAETEVPALVRVGEAWFYLLATPGELILDYAAYDPSAREGAFRGDLVTVLPSDGRLFLQALSEAVFPLDMVRQFLALNRDRARPLAMIDFDNARFLSSFHDQALGTWCGDAWAAEFGNPLSEVPDWVAASFEHAEE